MKISGHTKVFSILANPVHHVRTPQALNDLFQARGYNGVLVPVEVAAGEGLSNALTALRSFSNWGGTVVTVPHKTTVASLCDNISARAKAAGAVNVVRREKDGTLSGELLDGVGFVRGLRQGGHDLAGKSVFLAGAGGAASAIAFALAEADISRLTVVNRSRQKSEELVARLRDSFSNLSVTAEGIPSGHDIIVNGTSLGLKEDDPLPIDPQFLEEGMLVAEVIMSPEETALLRVAKEKGCLIHSGKAMLEGQLVEMFEFLTA